MHTASNPLLLTIEKESALATDLQRQELFLEQLYESTRKLDPSILEPFIDEDGSFVDGTKYPFLSELKK